MTKRKANNARFPSASAFWRRFLPSWLEAETRQSSVLRREIINTAWLFGDKVIRLGVGLVVLLALARYLGPSQFGKFNYALAFVSLFAPIGSLGLAGIVVRDLVAMPLSSSTTLGTALLLHVIGGLSAICLIAATITFSGQDDEVVKLMILILGTTIVLKAVDVIKYWFEAQVQSKFTVWAESAAFLVCSGATLLLIVKEAPLITFAWLVLAEAVIASIALLGVYIWKCGQLSDWNVTRDRIQQLLSDSWPLMLAGLAAITYMRIDQIMIGQLLGDEAVGVYSAAVRVSEVWYFIPTAIVASVFPKIVTVRKQSGILYEEYLQRLYSFLVVLALSVALPLTFCAEWLVSHLFGSAYRSAGAVLSIHVWAGVFIVLGILSSKSLAIENMQRHAFYRTSVGLTINVISNYLLIPRFGINGAAFATLLSQLFAAYLYDLLNKNTRPSFAMKTRALAIFRPFSESKG